MRFCSRKRGRCHFVDVVFRGRIWVYKFLKKKGIRSALDSCKSETNAWHGHSRDEFCLWQADIKGLIGFKRAWGDIAQIAAGLGRDGV